MSARGLDPSRVRDWVRRGGGARRAVGALFNRRPVRPRSAKRGEKCARDRGGARPCVAVKRSRAHIFSGGGSIGSARGGRPQKSRAAVVEGPEKGKRRPGGKERPATRDDFLQIAAATTALVCCVIATICRPLKEFRDIGCSCVLSVAKTGLGVLSAALTAEEDLLLLPPAESTRSAAPLRSTHWAALAKIRLTERRFQPTAIITCRGGGRYRLSYRNF